MSRACRETGFRIPTSPRLRWAGKSGMTIFFFLFGLLFIFDAFAAPAAHLVISQVQITGGPGKTTNDFVEIYNPTDSDIDLKGIRLVKRTKTGTSDTSLKSWTSETIIRAHGYFLWANSGFTDISAVPDAATSGSLADDNGVALRSGPNDTGTIIDSVAWGEAENVFAEGAVFAGNPEAGQSMERKPGGSAGSGEDTNNNAQDFFLQASPVPKNSQTPAAPPLTTPPPAPSPAPQPAPAPTPAPPPSPSPVPSPAPSPPPASEPTPAPQQVPAPEPQVFNLQFSEIMPNPEGADEGNEWVEIFNADTANFSLAGWYLDDEGEEPKIGSGAVTLDAGSTVPANGFFVIAIPKGKISLNNTSGDTARLFDTGKNLRLEKSYPGPAEDNMAFARDAQDKWQWTSRATPGAVNQISVAIQPEPPKKQTSAVQGTVIQMPSQAVTLAENQPTDESATSTEVTAQLADELDAEVQAVQGQTAPDSEQKPPLYKRYIFWLSGAVFLALVFLALKIFLPKRPTDLP